MRLGYYVNGIVREELYDKVKFGQQCEETERVRHTYWRWFQAEGTQNDPVKDPEMGICLLRNNKQDSVVGTKWGENSNGWGEKVLMGIIMTLTFLHSELGSH